MSVVNRLKEAEKLKKPLTKVEIYDIIKDYILDQIDLSSRKQRSEANFDSPAWSEKQAYQLGFQKGLEKVLEFIPDLDQRKEN
jgi:hypothetical protein